MEVRLQTDDVAQWAVPVTESSQVADARRRATTLARRIGLDETRAGAVAIVVTELGNNLVKHAQRGLLVIGSVVEGAITGLEILSLDHGPGMRDLDECLRDGYSTRSTAGTGLGAIVRQSDEFDVHSLVGQGTALVARLWPRNAAPRPGERGPLEVGAVCLPIASEDVPGDAWTILHGNAITRIAVADGLGHGPFAATAASGALRTTRENPDAAPAVTMARIHDALKATRGAVAAVVDVDTQRDVVHFCGVGNISGVLWSPQREQNMVSMNGTMGHALPHVREFSYSWPPEGLLVLHSDGLGTRWNLDAYAGLTTRDPTLIAGTLYRDFTRGRDDVTVVVARRRRR